MAFQTSEDRKADYELRKKLGLCSYCPRRASPARVLCSVCAEKARVKTAARRKRANEALSVTVGMGQPETPVVWQIKSEDQKP